MVWRRRPPRGSRLLPDRNLVETLVGAGPGAPGAPPAVALAARLDIDGRRRLVERALEVARAVRWEGVGLELTPLMVGVVAANAALPVLEVGLDAYRDVRSVIVRRGPARAAGAGHAGPVTGVVRSGGLVSGEAFGGTGPLMVDWQRARADSRLPQRGRNLVIHEFAHKIDSADGWSDGRPPLRGERAAAFDAVMSDEYDHTDERPSDAVLRPYAWASPAEFFAVASETFFCRPDELAAAKPALFAALADLYRLDLRTRP